MPLHSAGREVILTPTAASAHKVSCARLPRPAAAPHTTLMRGGGAPAQGTHA